jgi:hypothetical protein
MALNIAALIVLILVAGVVAYLLFFLGGLPGRIATQRRHPQADAIRIMGWLGLLSGIVWAAALCWAYVNSKQALPDTSPAEQESTGANSIQQRDRTASDSPGGI